MQFTKYKAFWLYFALFKLKDKQFSLVSEYQILI